MLKNYLECKQKFYYKYILKIAQRADTTPNDGQILHKVLENLFKDRSFYEDEEALRDNLKTLIAQEVDDSTVSNIYKKRLWERKLKHLVSKQIKHFSDEWRVVAREKRVYGEIGGLKFKGSIDRIDQTPTHSLVIDYKSGSIKKVNSIKKFENLSDFQMNIYKELTKKTLSNVEFAYIEILDSGDLIKVDRMDEKEEYLMEHIANLKATKTLNLEKRADIHNCNYCEYQLLCQRGAYLR
jgi:RecB family exonuclease